MSDPDWGQVELESRLWYRRTRPARARARLLALHGYAENPGRILAALDRPTFADVDIVAPLGPHQFYNRRGEVVGSWMTRFRRADQIRFLLVGLERMVRGIDRESEPLPWAVFGFSQGAATVHRLRVLSDLPFEAAYALAGDMPPEVEEVLGERSPRPVTLLWGTEDDRVPPATLQADAARYEAAGWPVETVTAPGGHDYLPALLDRVAAALPRAEV